MVWSYSYLICKACSEQLDVVYYFHQLCLSSNEKRQEAVRAVSVKTEDVDNENFVLHSDHSGPVNQAKEEVTNRLEVISLSKDRLIEANESNPLQIVEKHENDTRRHIDLRSGNVHKTLNSDNTKKGIQGENCPFVADYGCVVSGDVSTNFERSLQTAIPTFENRLYRDNADELSDSHTESITEGNKNIIKNSVASKYKRGSSCTRNSARSKKSVRYKSKLQPTKSSGEVGNETENQAMKVKGEGIDTNEFIDPPDYSYNDSGNANNSNINLKGLEKPNKVPNKANRRNNMNFRCDLCGSMFIFYIKFMEHSVMVHNLDEKEVRPYACTYCPKRFNKHSTLKDHAKSHDPVRNEMCSYCGKAFKTKRALTIHEKQHLDLREYQCPHCPKRFNTHKNRNTHIYILHSDPKTWKHECTICEKKFALKTTYIAHMRIHSDFKQFACHLCQKRFTDRTTLRNHLTSHSNVREHKCEECGNEYKNVKYLKIHLAKAHNIGNIKLPVRLKKHFCDMCPKAFFYKNKLLRHIYTHTGERPFPCSVCDKRFTDKSYAVQHMKTIHNIIPGKIEDSI